MVSVWLQRSDDPESATSFQLWNKNSNPLKKPFVDDWWRTLSG